MGFRANNYCQSNNVVQSIGLHLLVGPRALFGPGLLFLLLVRHFDHDPLVDHIFVCSFLLPFLSFVCLILPSRFLRLGLVGLMSVSCVLALVVLGCVGHLLMPLHVFFSSSSVFESSLSFSLLVYVLSCSSCSTSMFLNMFLILGVKDWKISPCFFVMIVAWGVG